MNQDPTGEQKSTEKDAAKQELAEAVRIVKGAIAEKVKQLKEIADGGEDGRVMVEGRTHTNLYITFMMEADISAQIMLKYDYPTYAILEEDAPQGMWDELAEEIGLRLVDSVELV